LRISQESPAANRAKPFGKNGTRQKSPEHVSQTTKLRRPPFVFQSHSPTLLDNGKIAPWYVLPRARDGETRDTRKFDGIRCDAERRESKLILAAAPIAISGPHPGHC
jgi:hypothetical protein